jgi:phage terminase large subunit-like protein
MTEQVSAAQVLARLSEEEREKLLSELSNETLASLKYNWEFWARPNQIEPEGDWTTWLILAGRGFGKSRCGPSGSERWLKKIRAVASP